jgi:hypothetical protein
MYHNVRPTGPAVGPPVRRYSVKAAKSHPFPAQGDMPANGWREMEITRTFVRSGAITVAPISDRDLRDIERSR